jgi:ATP/maltotriose-dependent transcriptional regulator MalT
MSLSSWREKQLVIQHAYLRSLELVPEASQAPRLSGRETEILGFVALGKSNGVIAEILSLSAGTVDTYLRRIFDKLDVADRTTAAVKGVSLGLIRI